MQPFLISARFCVASLIVICALPTAAAEESSGQIHIMASAPYKDGHDIRNNIINECTQLGSKLATFTQSFAKENGIEIVLDESINTASKGRVLKLEIADAVSRGNAFIGHSKYVAVKGALWENGNKVASFDGRRSSMGGFAGGYKGSCSVLGRCVKALGKDIAAWLSSPVDGASLGD